MPTEVNFEPPITRLNDKQQHAIRLLVVGGKLKQTIAETVGIDPATLSRWQTDPAFVAALNQAKQDAYDAVIQGLSTAMLKSLEALTGLLASEDEKMRQSSALALLRLGLKQAQPAGSTTLEDVLADQGFGRSITQLRLQSITDPATVQLVAQLLAGNPLAE